ncbi:sensor histidine kinase [Nocardiopsis potens]|uniref:sensor histidine kinase n=1 Tax=Nocardiopsis potens TaxID=1246458 RepID=UPI000346D51C|nr:histidine kinase [Nocardiopsis potens]
MAYAQEGPVRAAAGAADAAGVLRTWCRAAAGAAAGAVTALAACVLLAVLPLLALPALPAALATPWPAARRLPARVLGALVRPAVAVERRRLAALFGIETAGRPGTARSLLYLALRAPVGLFGGMVLALFPMGAYTVVSPLGVLDGNTPAVVPFGLALMYVSMQGTVGLVGTERWLARRLLGPTRQDLLEQRVGELAESRSRILAAVDEERRRIERDLHDGVQQRLVVLGMALGRARRDPGSEKGRELLLQAHEESRRALTDLREVAWRVYPTALSESGLHAALSGLAARSALPVDLDYRLDRAPEPSTATAAYFIVAEAVTNAVKHSGADRVSVLVGEAGPGSGGGSGGGPGSGPGDRPALLVRVSDDGAGGADPAGTGLAGLADRAAAVDGRLTVHSPAGGPTVILAELPCG